MHPEQIICLLLWISAGTHHMTQCQQLLMDGARSCLGAWPEQEGTEPCCPQHPMPHWGRTHGQGPTAPSYGVTTLPHCHRSTIKAGAWLSKASHGRECQWWQC